VTTPATSAESALALQRHAAPVVDRFVAGLVAEGRAYEVVVVIASWVSGTAEVLLTGTPLAVVYSDDEGLVAVWPVSLAARYVRSCPECRAVLGRVGPGECALLLATARDGGDGDDRIEVARRRV
jgi:hypothetical protein